MSEQLQQNDSMQSGVEAVKTKTAAQTKADAYKAIKKTNRIFDIFTNKDKMSPYPSYPFRAAYTKYGIDVVATSGDAYVIATFNWWTQDYLREAYPHRHRRPEYSSSPWYDKQYTEQKTIDIDDLNERLNDIYKNRPENPYMSFHSTVKICEENIPCVATLSQVAKLVACAKAAGVKTVEMFSCGMREKLDFSFVEASFYVGPYIVGLMMPVIKKD